jgi:hypothetical protein
MLSKFGEHTNTFRVTLEAVEAIFITVGSSVFRDRLVKSVGDRAAVTQVLDMEAVVLSKLAD